MKEDKNACPKPCRKVEVPTEEELRALRAMRSIKERVRSIRSRLSDISSGGQKPAEAECLEKELEKLRAEWEGWERERQKAAHRRMVLLGHEEPSAG